MPGSGAHASSQVRVACAFSSAGMLPVLGALGACALRARLPGAPVGARAAWRTLVPRRAASARRARRQRSSRQQRRARGTLCHLARQTESPQPVVMVSEPILMVSEQEPRQKLSKGGRSGDTRPSASCGAGCRRTGSPVSGGAALASAARSACADVPAGGGPSSAPRGEAQSSCGGGSAAAIAAPAGAAGAAKHGPAAIPAGAAAHWGARAGRQAASVPGAAAAPRSAAAWRARLRSMAACSARPSSAAACSARPSSTTARSMCCAALGAQHASSWRASWRAGARVA